MHNCTPEMLKIIALGFVVNIGANGALTALGSAILSSSAKTFASNTCAMATFDNPHSGGIIEQRLSQFLVIGLELDAGDTPPIVSMSPDNKGATKQISPLDEIMADEVKLGCVAQGKKWLYY